MPRKPSPKVYYHGRTRLESGQHVVTLSINGTRYEYYLASHQCDTVEYLCKKVSALKALGFAKSRALDVRRI